MCEEDGGSFGAEVEMESGRCAPASKGVLCEGVLCEGVSCEGVSCEGV